MLFNAILTETGRISPLQLTSNIPSQVPLQANPAIPEMAGAG